MAQHPRKPRGGRPLGSPNRSTSGARPKAPALTPERHRAVFGRAEGDALTPLQVNRRTPREELESELLSVERQLKILTHCQQQLQAEIAALPTALTHPAFSASDATSPTPTTSR